MQFATAIIDPPWPYEQASGNKRLKGYVSQKDNEQYATLSIEEMASLPIGEIVSSYLLMWTVGPFLREGLSLFDAWGFEYKTQMCWYKNTGLGVGYWFRGDHELVLIGKKPGVPSIRTGTRSLIASPRMRHSEKPDFLHEIVERSFPGSWLEVFGRRAREGWTVLGNEAPGDGADIRESLRGLYVSG